MSPSLADFAEVVLGSGMRREYVEYPVSISVIELPGLDLNARLEKDLIAAAQTQAGTSAAGVCRDIRGPFDTGAMFQEPIPGMKIYSAWVEFANDPLTPA